MPGYAHPHTPTDIFPEVCRIQAAVFASPSGSQTAKSNFEKLFFGILICKNLIQLFYLLFFLQHVEQPLGCQPQTFSKFDFMVRRDRGQQEENKAKSDEPAQAAACQDTMGLDAPALHLQARLVKSPELPFRPRLGDHLPGGVLKQTIGE